jgi:copper chaperone CopZ
MSVGWVKQVSVSFPTKDVTVFVQPEKFKAETLIEALNKAGFEESSVKNP